MVNIKNEHDFSKRLLKTQETSIIDMLIIDSISQFLADQSSSGVPNEAMAFGKNEIINLKLG